jgi:hypothetical protein
VRPFHFASRSASAVRTSRTSGGTSCITPAATRSTCGLPPDGNVGFAAARGALPVVAADRLPLTAAPLGLGEGLDLAERLAPRSDADSRLVSDFMLQSYALGGPSATGRRRTTRSDRKRRGRRRRDLGRCNRRTSWYTKPYGIS